MAIKTNANIRTKGIEIIPETNRITGQVTWMFRFTRLNGSRQSSNEYPGPFEALAEALHTLREEGAYYLLRNTQQEYPDPRWPRACLRCEGRGYLEIVPGREDPGEKYSCPRCIDEDRCPRCGEDALHTLPDIDPESVDLGYEPGHGPCAGCGWTYNTTDMPKPIDHADHMPAEHS